MTEREWEIQRYKCMRDEQMLKDERWICSENIFLSVFTALFEKPIFCKEGLKRVKNRMLKKKQLKEDGKRG